jgi:hypothetical protein
LSSADWITFYSKQPAGNYVTLDTAQTITAQKTFTGSGSSDTMIISHGSGSGFALDVIKGGSGEAIRVTKTSGSGNAMTISGGNFEAGTIVKTGGTSTQYLMADGSTSTLTNPVTGTGTSGQVAFWNGTSSQTGDNGLFWNNTNKRLGIGTTTPTQDLDVSGNIKLNNSSQLMWRNAANNADIPILQLTNNNILNIGTTSSSIPSSIILHSNSVAYFRLFSTGNVVIQNGGTFTDAGFRLDVNGTARVQGGLTVGTQTASAFVHIAAQGSLITDNVFRIRNSANTFDIMKALGDGTVSIGIGAGNVNSGSNNIFFGGNSGRDTSTGGNNIFIGFQAGRFNTTGTINTFIGADAGLNTTTSASNSFFGGSSGRNNTTGNENSGFGFNAGRENTTGTQNAFFGVAAGRFIADGTTANTITNNSVFLGSQSRALADNQTNQIVIGHTAIGLGSNTTVIGNSSTTFGRWFGNLLVGTSTNAGFALDVNGTARVTGAITGTSTLTLGQTGTAGEVILNRSSNGAVVGGIRADGNGAEIGGSGYSSKILCSNGGTRIQFFTTTERMRLEGGNLLIGTTTDVASSILTVDSTTKGFLPPRMTTTQKNAIASPATGLVVYDNTLNKLSVFTGATWETVTSL